MPVLALLCILLAACPAMAQKPQVSIPLSFQIDASASPEPGANLARLVNPSNVQGVALGEWIEFDFGKPVVVTGVTVVNGWADSGSFRQYGRVKGAVLVFQEGGRHSLTLKDSDKPQTLAVTGKGQKVRLSVASVYPGTASSAPYLSRIAFTGYDPSVQQVTLTGRYEGCVRSGSSSNVGGVEQPFYYCARFRAEDGSLYGCLDDLCFHPKEHVGVRLKVTGLVKPGNVLEVLEAVPVGDQPPAGKSGAAGGKARAKAR
jgi:hypothetical protein